MNRFLITFMSGICAIALYLLGLHLDLFEALIGFLQQMEYIELDELLIPLLLIFLGFVIDMLRYRKRMRLKSGRLRDLRAAMVDVQRIMNNMLNKLLYYELLMRKSHDIDRSDVDSMREMIDEASADLRRLTLAEEPPESHPGEITEEQYES